MFAELMNKQWYILHAPGFTYRGLKFRSMNTSTHRWELLGKFSLVESIAPSSWISPFSRGPGAAAGKKREGSGINRPRGHKPTVHSMPHSACHPAITYQPLLGTKGFYFIKPQHMIRSICPVWVFLLFYEGSSLPGKLQYPLQIGHSGIP